MRDRCPKLALTEQLLQYGHVAVAGCVVQGRLPTGLVWQVRVSASRQQGTRNLHGRRT